MIFGLGLYVAQNKQIEISPWDLKNCGGYISFFYIRLIN